MGERTKIAWTDHTFNPWIGCTKVAAGCVNCYAEADFDRRRHRATWGPQGTRVRTSATNWAMPRKWNLRAEHYRLRERVFCASLCDVFEDWDAAVLNSAGRELWFAPSEIGRYPGMPENPESLCDLERQNIADGLFRKATLDDLRGDLFRTIDSTQNLDWLLLTKRPENVRRMWPGRGFAENHPCPDRRSNVWIGCSASTQEDLDAAVPHLLACRDLSPVLFLSLEPLLAALNLESNLLVPESGCNRNYLVDYRQWAPKSGIREPRWGRQIDWVIVGGESGPKARPCDVAWIRDVVRQCKCADVSCFVKQLGTHSHWDADGRDSEYGPEIVMCDCDPMPGRFKTADSKGGDPDEWPEYLRVREFPDAATPSPLAPG